MMYCGINSMMYCCGIRIYLLLFYVGVDCAMALGAIKDQSVNQAIKIMRLCWNCNDK